MYGEEGDKSQQDEKTPEKKSHRKGGASSARQRYKMGKS